MGTELELEIQELLEDFERLQTSFMLDMDHVTHISCMIVETNIRSIHANKLTHA
jgi:hypothetical protein